MDAPSADKTEVDGKTAKNISNVNHFISNGNEFSEDTQLKGESSSTSRNLLEELAKQALDNDHKASDNVLHRMSKMEERILHQENEILMLKTCICDLIRRLENVTKSRSKDGPHRDGMSGRRVSGLSLGNLNAMPELLPSPLKSPKSEEFLTEDHDDRKSNKSPDKTPTSPRRRYSRQKSFEMSQFMAGKENNDTPALKASIQRRSSAPLRRSLSQSQPRDEASSSKDESSVKFYMRGRGLTFYPPSNYKQPKTGAVLPDKTLSLEWVYGYRGRDSRNNLIALPNGDLVYNMAAVVVLYNRGTGTQRHYVEHNDDVKCLTSHPDGVTMASGQVAGHDKAEGKPHVRIWSSLTLETSHVIGLGEFERAISCLAFSKKDEGKYLAVVDEANEHVVSLWDWCRNQKLSDHKGYNEAVFGLDFNPVNPKAFITYGRSHIAFWSITDDDKITKKMGVFEKNPKPKFILSAIHNSAGDVITGDSNGNIFVWSQGANKVTHVVKEAHQGGVFSLCLLGDGCLLTGGGKDKHVKMWTSSMKPSGNGIELPGNVGGIRSIMECGQDDTGCRDLAIGTTKNCILDGSLENGFGLIVQGHVDEMWGLATHPNKNLFATCAYDGLLCLWDAETHENIWRKALEDNSAAQSAAFHPTEDILVVGMRSGKWLVYDIETQQEVAVNTDSSEQVDVIHYSPDGQLLAVGTHENAVTIYQCPEKGTSYKRLGKLTGHSSFVTHLDWSVDGQFIQTNSGDYECLYWHAGSCRQVVSASAMRDVEWKTWTCVFGFPVMGIWPEGADGTDINTCCRSNAAGLVATGDDFGKVNLFTFPATALKMPGHQYKGHSSHVTCVRFMHNSQHLISVGGKDSSVMQWKVI